MGKVTIWRPPAAGRRELAVALVAALVMSAALAGCGLGKTIQKVADTVHANKATIDQFTSKLKSGQPAQFQVTYVTTGSSPSKIIYAVRSPDQLAITDSLSSGGAVAGNASFIVNSAGAYACTRGSNAAWTCDKLPKTGAAADKKLLDIYTPAHWITFLQDFSLAAGFAGDKISSSRITVNGFGMQCVDFVAAGVAGTSKICTTAQHLLGYVRVASQSTGFEITAYSTSPAPALFRLPAGATITQVKGGTS
jgi:hypothetical protein